MDEYQTELYFQYAPWKRKGLKALTTHNACREPSLKTKTMTLAAALTNWAAAGFKIVEQEKFNERLDICKSCAFWDKGGMAGTGKCLKCGCSTQAKLRLATSYCPIGKW